MRDIVHYGQNLKRLREILGIKQNSFAKGMGSGWNQKKISVLETKEYIKDNLLEKAARVLKITVDTIKKFDEEKILFNIQNDYLGILNNEAKKEQDHQLISHQLDRVIKFIEEIKYVYADLLIEKNEKLMLAQKQLEALLKSNPV